jgi:hypothetical protein
VNGSTAWCRSCQRRSAGITGLADGRWSRRTIRCSRPQRHVSLLRLIAL